MKPNDTPGPDSLLEAFKLGQFSATDAMREGSYYRSGEKTSEMLTKRAAILLGMNEEDPGFWQAYSDRVTRVRNFINSPEALPNNQGSPSAAIPDAPKPDSTGELEPCPECGHTKSWHFNRLCEFPCCSTCHSGTLDGELELANRYHWGEDWSGKYPTLEYLKVAQPDDYAAITTLVALIRQRDAEHKAALLRAVKGRTWDTTYEHQKVVDLKVVTEAIQSIYGDGK